MRTPDEVAAMLRLKTLGWPPSRTTVRLQGSAEGLCRRRPARAVAHFVRWARDPSDARRKLLRDIFARTRLLTCSAGSLEGASLCLQSLVRRATSRSSAIV